MEKTELLRTNFLKKIFKKSQEPAAINVAEMRRLGILSFSAIKQSSIKQSRKALRVTRQQKSLDCFVEVTWQKYHNIWEYQQSPEAIHRHSRDLANTLYDIPPKWTGYSSVLAKEQNEFIKEHFYPRQWAGSVIIEYIMEHNGITHGEIKEFFDVFRQVHHTSKNENATLRKFQNPTTFVNWQLAYRQASIILIHERDVGQLRTLDNLFGGTYDRTKDRSINYSKSRICC